MKYFRMLWGATPASTIIEVDPRVQREAQWVQDAVFHEALAQIRDVVSCPPTVFTQLYRQTLLNLAQQIQKVPVSIEDDVLYLTHVVEQAVRALKYKREWLLPQGAHTEQMAACDPAWTFAVFSSALCQGWLDWVLRWRFFWRTEETEPTTWHMWSPSVGSLPWQATHYRWEACDEKTLLKTDEAVRQGFGVAHWFPVEAMQWLYSFPAVIACWWPAVENRLEDHNPLGNMLRESLREMDLAQTEVSESNDVTDKVGGETKVVAKEGAASATSDEVCESKVLANEGTPVLSVGSNDRAAQVALFLDALSEGMLERRWAINQPDAPIFRVMNGWLVAMPLVQTLLTHKEMELGCEVFVEALQKQRVLWCEDEAAVVEYLNLALTPPVCFKGVVVLASMLSDEVRYPPYGYLKSVKQMGER